MEFHQILQQRPREETAADQKSEVNQPVKQETAQYIQVKQLGWPSQQSEQCSREEKQKAEEFQEQKCNILEE